MSIYRKVEINCPRCDGKSNTLIWETLNSQLNPEAKEKLLEGKINQFACTICGFEAPIQVPFLYHDMENKFVVRFYPFSMVEKEDFLSEFNDDGQMPLAELPNAAMTGSEYFKQMHIVFSMEELIRYVVFHDKLAQRNLKGK